MKKELFSLLKPAFVPTPHFEEQNVSVKPFRMREVEIEKRNFKTYMAILLLLNVRNGQLKWLEKDANKFIKNTLADYNRKEGTSLKLKSLITSTPKDNTQKNKIMKDSLVAWVKDTLANVFGKKLDKLQLMNGEGLVSELALNLGMNRDQFLDMVCKHFSIDKDCLIAENPERKQTKPSKTRPRFSPVTQSPKD